MAVEGTYTVDLALATDPDAEEPNLVRKLHLL